MLTSSQWYDGKEQRPVRLSTIGTGSIVLKIIPGLSATTKVLPPEWRGPEPACHFTRRTDYSARTGAIEMQLSFNKGDQRLEQYETLRVDPVLYLHMRRKDRFPIMAVILNSAMHSELITDILLALSCY